MITRIEARRYRSLKHVDQHIGSFQALVGPNASGKTTFLDVISFVSSLIRNRGDIVETVEERSSQFQKLLWLGAGNSFELCIEARIPDAIRSLMEKGRQRFTHVRYELEVGLDSEKNEIGLDHETLLLVTPETTPIIQRTLFPDLVDDSHSIFQSTKRGKNMRAAINKKPGGNDNYYVEGRKSYAPSFRLGRTRSALAHVPADEDSFPVSTWFRSMVESGVQEFVLNSKLIRQPSPPGLGKQMQPDGSNLPWVIDELSKDPAQHQDWVVIFPH